MGISPFRIELFISITGLEFSECYPRREQKRVNDIEVSVIDLENLIKNKRLVGRHKDLDDIENLV